MRRQGRSFKDASDTAHHELKHVLAVKSDKRTKIATDRKGRAWAIPQDPLSMEELHKMSTAVGEENMSDADRKNAKIAKFFMWLDRLFKR